VNENVDRFFPTSVT